MKSIICSSVMSVAVLFLTHNCYAADFAGLVKDAEAKYATYRQNVSDLVIVQDTTMVTNSGKIPVELKMYVKEPKFRAETTMNIQGAQGSGAMQNTIVYDGKDIWMISPLMGKSKLPGGKEKDYQSKSNWWALISDKAQITGNETIGNHDCYVVEAQNSGASTFNKLWVDKDKLILVKAENKDQSGKTMTLVFSDFKDTKGWELPYKTEMYYNGQLASETNVKSIEYNTGVSDDFFDATKIQVKEFNMQDIMKQMGNQKQQ